MTDPLGTPAPLTGSDHSRATYEQIMFGTTGSGYDLHALIKAGAMPGQGWLNVGTSPAPGSAQSDGQSGGTAYSYHAWDKWYINVSKNANATYNWDNALTEMNDLMPSLAIAKLGPLMDVDKVRDAKSAVDKYVLWLSTNLETLRQWVNKLSSDDSAFKGKAAYAIKQNLDKITYTINDLHEQIVTERKTPEQLQRTADALLTFGKGMADLWYAHSNTLAGAVNYAMGSVINNVHNYILGRGLAHGTPNYLLDYYAMQSRERAEQYIRETVSGYSSTANTRPTLKITIQDNFFWVDYKVEDYGMATFTPSTLPEGFPVISGPLDSQATWDTVNRAISDYVKKKMEPLDQQARVLLSALQTAYEGTKEPLEALDTPTPPPTGGGNGNNNPFGNGNNNPFGNGNNNPFGNGNNNPFGNGNNNPFGNGNNNPFGNGNNNPFGNGNNNPFGNGNNNPFGDGNNNPFGNGNNNPFGDGNSNPNGNSNPFGDGNNNPFGNGNNNPFGEGNGNPNGNSNPFGDGNNAFANQNGPGGPGPGGNSTDFLAGNNETPPPNQLTPPGEGTATPPPVIPPVFPGGTGNGTSNVPNLRTNENGGFVDAEGNPVDINGNPVDANGNPVTGDFPSGQTTPNIRDFIVGDSEFPLGGENLPNGQNDFGSFDTGNGTGDFTLPGGNDFGNSPGGNGNTRDFDLPGGNGNTGDFTNLPGGGDFGNLPGGNGNTGGFGNLPGGGDFGNLPGGGAGGSGIPGDFGNIGGGGGLPNLPGGGAGGAGIPGDFGGGLPGGGAGGAGAPGGEFSGLGGGAPGGGAGGGAGGGFGGEGWSDWSGQDQPFKDGGSQFGGDFANRQGGMPMMPPPMMPPMSGNGDSKERERQTWLSEDDKVWGTDNDAGIGIIGLPNDDRYEADEPLAPTHVHVSSAPARGKPAEQDKQAEQSAEQTANG